MTTRRWFSTHRAGPDTVHLFLSGNDIGVFSDDNELARLKDELGDAQDVELLIDSPGGDTTTALGVYDLLKGRNVTTTIAGQCWSAAVIIMAASKRVRMQREASIMIHAPSDAVFGDAAFLAQRARGLEKLTGKIADIICKRTGQPAEIVACWLGKDTWFTPEQALAAGLVDEIIERPQISIPARPAQPAQAGDPAAVAPHPSEALFKTWLTAFGDVTTADKGKFMDALYQWAQVHVKQTTTNQITNEK